MRRILAATTVLVPLMAACTLTPQQQTKVDSALQSVPGQLFCQFQLAGGGTAIVALVNGSIAGLAPGAALPAIIATGASKAFVDKSCADAAAKAGAVTGAPVSPPPDAVVVPKVAVVPPVA